MLTIKLPATEFFDENSNTFKYFKETNIQLEHSLISISKWESKYHKAFLNKKDLTADELFYYIKCMTVTQNVPDHVYQRLTQINLEEIQRYISDPMSATTFYDDGDQEGKSKSREVITSELIYYWMVAQNIPVEFEKWHLNRLLNLIRICSIKNNPGKKMSKNEIARRNSMLNAQRRAALGTKG